MKTITAFFLDGPWNGTWHKVNFGGNSVTVFRTAYLLPDYVTPASGLIEWKYCDYSFFKFPCFTDPANAGYIWVGSEDKNAAEWLFQDEDAKAIILNAMPSIPPGSIYLEKAVAPDLAYFAKGLDVVFQEVVTLDEVVTKNKLIFDHLVSLNIVNPANSFLITGV